MTNALQTNFGEVTRHTVLEAALKYAAHGWQVFPCIAGQKRPACNSWKNQATADTEQLKRLFGKNSKLNLGFVVPTQLLVLDVDTKNGKVGAESLAALEMKYGKLPENSPRQQTWSGGYHLLFKLPEGMKVGISAGLVGKDLDIRSGGDGYILCEPSVIEGSSYQWVSDSPLTNEELDIPYAPEWLIGLATKKSSEGGSLSKSEIIAPMALRKAKISENESITRVASALAALPPEFADDRDKWVSIAASLHSVGDESYFDLFFEWSKTSPKFNEDACNKLWDSFKRKPGEAGGRELATLSSLFYHSRLNGWSDISSMNKDSSQGEPLTDLGNAKRLVALHGESIRYCKENRSWLCWDHSFNRWVWDSDHLMRLAAGVSASIFDEAKEAGASGKSEIAIALTKHAMKTQSLRNLKALVELASYEEGVAISLASLDSDSWLMAVENGVLNLKTGLLRPPEKDYYITKRAHVAYDSASGCPTWEGFLNKVMGGNQSMIDYLQRAIGYSMTGSTSEQVMFLCHGYGANGKSVLLNVLSGLVGDYAATAQAESLMSKREGSGINNDVARLRGARLVTTSETEDGRRFAEAQIKQLTGGDSITARYLYAEFFEFTPVFKIWMAMNHRPIIQGDDLGIWRRIVLIPFAVTIPESQRDGNLLKKLANEYAGILNWALAGCLEWQRIGLSPPSEIKAATEGYKADMDTIGNWLDDCCEINPTEQCMAATLYASYREWGLLNGRFPISNTRFGQKLQERGFVRRRSNGFVYEGLQLLI